MVKRYFVLPICVCLLTLFFYTPAVAANDQNLLFNPSFEFGYAGYYGGTSHLSLFYERSSEWKLDGDYSLKFYHTLSSSGIGLRARQIIRVVPNQDYTISIYLLSSGDAIVPTITVVQPIGDTLYQNSSLTSTTNFPALTNGVVTRISKTITTDAATNHIEVTYQTSLAPGQALYLDAAQVSKGPDLIDFVNPEVVADAGPEPTPAYQVEVPLSEDGETLAVMRTFTYGEIVLVTAILLLVIVIIVYMIMRWGKEWVR